MLHNFVLLLPELTVIPLLTAVLIFLTILLKRVSTVKKNNIFSRNLLNIAWYLVFLLSLLYFFLLSGSEPVFLLENWDLRSHETLYCLRLIFAFIFIIFLLYLKSDLSNFIFYSYDFLVILLFSFISLNFVLLSYSLLNLFIFIEIFSLTIYYLIAAAKKNSRSLEAAIKYYIFGSISSIFLLFGFYLFYLSTGLYKFSDISLYTLGNSSLQYNILFNLSVLFISLSLLAKIGASFFFFWLVEVYDGIDYPVFVFLSLFGKVSYIFVLFSLLDCFNLYYVNFIVQLLLISSLFYGAFGALYETKVKRFLLYTSLFNISFFSVNFWSINIYLTPSFLIFSFIYLFNTFIFMLCFFSIKDWTTNLTIKNLSDLLTIKYQNKYLSYCLIYFSAVNGGLPMFSMFFVKYTIILEFTRIEFFFWTFLLLLIATLALFYYARIIKALLQPTKTHSIFLQPLSFTQALIFSFSIFFNLLYLVIHEELYFLFFL